MSPPIPPFDAVESDAVTHDELEELRQLLFAREVAQLTELQRRLDDLRLRAADVGSVLPAALAAAPDDDLDRVLAPNIERAIQTSVRKDPKPLADAIYPVIGPAIRKAIREALSGIVQAFNQAVEHSLTPRGLRWRWESVRTGVPFGEVVLRHSLIYRVEQVFLIHKETGLPLQHVALDISEAQDPDMVSGMMTAIQDFVSDSFKAGEGAGLHGFTVGDVFVRVEQGPNAVLAAVIRGHAPNALGTKLQDTVEAVHLEFGNRFAEFTGDATPFEPARPLLESCLLAQLEEEEAERRKLSPMFISVVAILTALVVVWGVFRFLEWRRWSRALDALRAEPGLVVLDSDRHRGGRRVVGLRDPGARDPALVVAAAGYDSAAVTGEWEGFLSFDSALVAHRAGEILRPPASATLEYDAGVLIATGSAPPEWHTDAERAAATVPGVVALDLSGLGNADIAALHAAATRIGERQITFAFGSAVLGPEGRATIAGIVDLLDGLLDRMGDSLPTLELTGRADTTGASERNQLLSLQRAEVVQAALVAAGFPADRVVARGIGAADPLTEGVGRDASERNRSVSFVVRYARPTGN